MCSLPQSTTVLRSEYITVSPCAITGASGSARSTPLPIVCGSFPCDAAPIRCRIELIVVHFAIFYQEWPPSGGCDAKPPQYSGKSWLLVCLPPALSVNNGASPSDQVPYSLNRLACDTMHSPTGFTPCPKQVPISSPCTAPPVSTMCNDPALL